MKAVWLELDRRRPIKMQYPTDVKTRQEEIQKDRIYDLLARLHDEYNKVRGDIMRMTHRGSLLPYP